MLDALKALPLLLLVAPQEPRPGAPEGRARASEERPAEKADARQADKAPEKAPEKEDPPVVTKHELRLAGGRVVRYSVTTGLMPLKSDTGEL